MPRFSIFLCRATVWRAVALACAAAGTLAIVSTYRVFSQTHDEPAHIAAGLEWLSAGHYTFEAQHPPLARIAAAIGPYLDGERTVGTTMWGEGARLLGSGEHYVRTLALARLGELPFFLLLCVVVWLWGQRLGGDAGGALAVVFTATNPNVLAHAALATTDIAPTALVAASLFTFERWLAAPNWKRSAIFGACVGLAFVSKFSSLAFLGPALIIGYGLYARDRDRWRLERAPEGPSPLAACAVVVSVTLLIVFAIYRFDVGPLTPDLGVVLPAPMFFQGLLDFATHGALGHTAFLFGEVSAKGWWYYFPVVLLMKTPLPLLAFGLIGSGLAVRAARRRAAWAPALPVAGIVVVLIVGVATRVDIGVRHILPLYPLLAVLAAHGVVAVWQQLVRVQDTLARAGRSVVIAAVAMSVVIAVRAHPDHLAYFSITAGPHPERVLSDSNLDWGQDLYRLADEMQRRRIDSLRLAYFGSADPAAAGVRHTTPLAQHERASGWIAVSETYLAGVWSDTGYVWLRAHEPVTRVGRSMRLYWLPPRAVAAVAPRGTRAR